MIKKIFIIFLAVIFLCNMALAYAMEPLSLNAIIQEAKDKNPEILASQKRWEAAKARIPQAKSLEDPKVGVSFKKISKGTVKLGETMSEDRMLSISQAFPFVGKLSLKGKIALAQSQMYAAEYKNKEQEIVNKVENAYYDLFLNFKEVELNEDNLKFLEAVINIAQAKYVVGEISQDEIFKLNLEIAKLSNLIQNLKQEQSAKKTRLNTLLNRSPEESLGIPQLGEDISFNISVDNLYKLTLENQPELAVFSYAIEENKHAKSLAKRNLFPDIMTEVGLRGITGGGVGLWDLALAFSLPFWFWTKQRYEIKESIANLEEAQASYQAMKNKALAQTKGLAINIEIANNKIDLYKNSLMPILESSIDSSLAAFRSGKGNLMLLLDNIRMLIDNKMAYYKALVEYNIGMSDLERAVGKKLSNSEVGNEEK